MAVRKSNKVIILNDEMSNSILKMLQSNDSKDRDMAWKIISKRDIGDESSNICYNLMTDEILKLVNNHQYAGVDAHLNNVSVHNPEAWIIKYKGGVLKVGTKRVYASHQSASSSLTNNFRYLLGNEMVKKIFGEKDGHIKLKNFLIENKIIEFVNLMEDFNRQNSEI